MKPRDAAESPTTDAAFRKYDESGAYHWREVGRHWIGHNAITAERYRRVLGALGNRPVRRLLDVGCGDGALLGVARPRFRDAELHGYDPSAAGLRLAHQMLEQHGIVARLHGDPNDIPQAFFDAVICTEVIEHVHDPGRLLTLLARALAPGGAAVVTTPVRLTEEPEDTNHQVEWFPREFRRLCESSGLRPVSHDLVMPVACVEAYFWRPRLFFRVPVFRLISNLLSIYAGVNASSWLAMRPRLHMMQIAVLEKP